MIISLFSLALIAWLFYFLFIKGEMYPYILLLGGIWGITQLLKANLIFTKQVVMTFLSYEISLAAIIATIICILGIGVIMEK